MNEMEINSLQETLFNLQNKKREIAKNKLTKTATTNQLTAAKFYDLAYSVDQDSLCRNKYEGGEMYSSKVRY